MAGEGQAITGEGALYEVAYEEAARALSEQLSLIDSFRTRAGLLLSAGAITTSVFGSRALGQGWTGFASWAALAAFFGLALLSMAIFWPRPEEFAFDAIRVLESHIELGSSGPAVNLHWILAIQMRRSHAANSAVLSQMASLFEIACILLAAEVLSWAISAALII